MVNFEKILSEDEYIIKEYKPNKTKFYVSGIIFFVIFLLVFFSIIVGAILEERPEGVIYLLILSAVVILFLVLFTSLKVMYNKRLYAYSNKRILIQSGFIGTDYKSLDLEFIGASEVRVDILDKIIKKNTGTIRFGSQATPNSSQGGIQTFVFSDIFDPYEVYKEIKKHIDSKKNKEVV